MKGEVVQVLSDAEMLHAQLRSRSIQYNIVQFVMQNEPCRKRFSRRRPAIG